MADPKQMAHDLGVAAAKTAPPAAVTLWAWMGSNLPTAVALATLVYILLQIAHLVWVWRRERRRGRILSLAHDQADE